MNEETLCQALLDLQSTNVQINDSDLVADLKNIPILAERYVIDFCYIS